MITDTDEKYWDCECDSDYVHARTDRNMTCPLCLASEEDQPDSRVNEIKYLFKPTSDLKLIPYSDIFLEFLAG